jgi:hypothetical protein
LKLNPYFSVEFYRDPLIFENWFQCSNYGNIFVLKSEVCSHYMNYSTTRFQEIENPKQKGCIFKSTFLLWLWILKYIFLMNIFENHPYFGLEFYQSLWQSISMQWLR